MSVPTKCQFVGTSTRYLARKDQYSKWVAKDESQLFHMHNIRLHIRTWASCPSKILLDTHETNRLNLKWLHRWISLDIWELNLFRTTTAFESILRQDISCFNKSLAEALPYFLSTEATNVAGLSGVTLGTLLNVRTSLVARVALSIVVAWKLVLATNATISILLVCSFCRFHILAGFEMGPNVT